MNKKYVLCALAGTATVAVGLFIAGKKARYDGLRAAESSEVGYFSQYAELGQRMRFPAPVKKLTPGFPAYQYKPF